MRPETLLVILMFCVLIITTLTVYALWHFHIHGHLIWPLG